MQLTTDIYQRIAIAKVFIDDNYQEPIDLDQMVFLLLSVDLAYLKNNTRLQLIFNNILKRKNGLK